MKIEDEWNMNMFNDHLDEEYVNSLTNENEKRWLNFERHIWQLIFCLYNERLRVKNEIANQMDQDEDDNICQYKQLDEKDIIDKCYRNNQLVREIQLVIDWLERVAGEDDRFAKNKQSIYQFTDLAVSWENTLHQIQMPTETEFKDPLKQIVTYLHPDVAYVENRALNSLDMEDADRLSREIFYEIRCGRLDNAKRLCTYCGHDWKAAIFEGWRLHNDPNLKNDRYFKPILGNSKRDIWKINAWCYAHCNKLNKYERASIAAYCGALEPLLNVSETWEDELWAYLRTIIDIKVESEIRDNLLKKFESMPSEYWSNKIHLEEVFANLSNDWQNHFEFEKDLHCIIQCIILDNIDPIVNLLEFFLNFDRISVHFLRFLTHLILFLHSVDRINNDYVDLIDNVLEKYVLSIMNPKNSETVAFYVSKMQESNQVKIFAKYLENLEEKTDQDEALKNAESYCLNIKEITKTAVETIRQKAGSEINAESIEYDTKIIDSMNLLLHNENQKRDALIQCNSTINYFLRMGKCQAAATLMNKLPDNLIAKDENDMNLEEDPELSNLLHEFLSYKAYLNARNAFNKWFDFFTKCKPTKPADMSESNLKNFTEKVAHEHKLNQYENDLVKWQTQLKYLTKLSEMYLFNVLLFPNGGWLSKAENSDVLRSKYIPEVVFLLYKIMCDTEEFEKAVSLVDTVASSKYDLYKSFSQYQLKDLFTKLTQCYLKIV